MNNFKAIIHTENISVARGCELSNIQLSEGRVNALVNFLMNESIYNVRKVVSLLDTKSVNHVLDEFNLSELGLHRAAEDMSRGLIADVEKVATIVGCDKECKVIDLSKVITEQTIDAKTELFSHVVYDFYDNNPSSVLMTTDKIDAVVDNPAWRGVIIELYQKFSVKLCIDKLLVDGVSVEISISNDDGAGNAKNDLINFAPSVFSLLGKLTLDLEEQGFVVLLNQF